MQNTTQICPTCGCTVGPFSYEKGGILYCCEPCAKGEPCTCADCTTRDPDQEKFEKKTLRSKAKR